MTSPRQPAYDAVYAAIRQHPPLSADDYGQAAENARVWRAVEAALDGMGVPGSGKSAVAIESPQQSLFGWHVAGCGCLTMHGTVLGVDARCTAPATSPDGCPRCGGTDTLTRWDICAPCTAEEGFDPPCAACDAEGKGESVTVLHVDTCAGTPKQPTTPRRRLKACVERWPGAEIDGDYDLRCCRFPKSCSASVYDDAHVTEDDLESRR